ncbi:subtilisin-like protease SBT5.4 [Andrographis paniculata]|uniref:subtilisin-like protease SBT5.4 n=1 Tax=Andrographis paniculata TaxID=175694 RepID=UPI0021E8A0AC|nr:subtilisin-like protease SBT5.4 [Andrographis paniculata]
MSTMFPAALFFVILAVFQEPAIAVKKSYVVYLGEQSHASGLTTTDADLDLVTQSHSELLSSVVGREGSLIYSYRKNINGFVAILDDDEAARMRESPGVVSVFEDKGKILHTSRSWEFMRLEKNGVIHPLSLWKRANLGEDIIIANLDTGVWPESKSFDDKGFGPIPSKWRGTCDFGGNNSRSLCNKKLIGARYFNKGFMSNAGALKFNSTYNTARDTEGHGTHTLSTAGGNFVAGASIFGTANGTIKGGSPMARVASYKVCWPPTKTTAPCYESDIMKGFDTAISDGVDVLSVSLGGEGPAEYLDDAIAIGAFHAVMKGIPVVASAGNTGTDSSVTNVAPWIITVAASSIDREFEASVKLGDGTVLKGSSLSKPLPDTRMYPLITGGQAKAANVSARVAMLCGENSLDPEKAKGKIVICLRGISSRVDKGVEAGRAGAVGFVLCNDAANGDDISADTHLLPATHLSYKNGVSLFSYINATKKPVGLITPPTPLLNTKPAPRLALFSSRGPNLITPAINKPDITAPGVDIIASYTEAQSPTESLFDKRRTPYLELSGTSMSCPHVAGVVGLIRRLHPDWSPAAIRSAIMTTARTRDNTVRPLVDAGGRKATPFGYGSGHIRPNRVSDPGLVYDLTVNDYLDFLCAAKYDEDVIRRFSGSKHACPANFSVMDFNNPAITVPSLAGGQVTVRRSVKLVGSPAKYYARVRSPYGYSVSVEPGNLNFEKTGEVKVFKVTIKALKPVSSYRFGDLTWTDGRHYVRTPILVASAVPE